MKLLRFCLPILLILPSNTNAQFKWIFTSEPDSAAVIVNDSVRCHTPCAVDYRWSENVNGRIVFAVEADGYDRWVDSVLQKPVRILEQTNVTLDRSKLRFKLDSVTAVVGFDKLVADMKDGTVIGTYIDARGISNPIKWEGSVKVGDEAFERSFYNILTNAGVPNSMRESAKLFSGAVDGRQKAPRYLVGAQLEEYSVDVRYANKKEKDYGAGGVTCRTRAVVDWQVLDRISRKVVLTVRTEGIARQRQRYGGVGSENLLAFEDALMKFLDEGRFMELLKNSAPAASVPDLKEEARRFNVKPIVNPAFGSVAEMIRYADRSCVTVITEDGHGSGVIINSEGYVLSAYHVVSGSNSIEVMFSDGLRQQATILHFDEPNDIVLLDIAGSGFRALPLSGETPAGLGDDVVTIGTPADVTLGQSVSKGILSGRRVLEDREYIQTDLAVSPGNSGGPLLNDKGEVIGVIQSKFIGKGIEGVSFAMPIQRVKAVLNLEMIP
jgi:S1-C subfamily serine protease